MSEQFTDPDGHTYTVDSDGDRLWDQPADWSLDKNPDKMNLKELSAACAKLLGCRPKWWAYYADWVCGCKGNQHGCDQQCSAIADYTGDARYARQVAEHMEEHGLLSPRATATPVEICRAALHGLAKNSA